MCMKKVLMSMTMLFALGCFAQTSSQSSSGSTTPSQSTPSSSNPDTMSPSSGAAQGGYGSQTPSSQTAGSQAPSESKGKAKTIQGCMAGSGGNFTLQEKGGKSVNLESSQDLTAHVGHEVKVHGHWASAGATAGAAAESAGTAAPGTAASDTGAAAGKAGKAAAGAKTFMVDSVDMVSEQCKTK
jgi:hypothetical protein